MANRYVYHGGSNTSPYDTWAKAATTLATAITGSAAGDDFWVASDHSESTAGAVSLSFPGSAASPNRCISVNRAGSTPPVAADILAGATIATTTGNITATGRCYVYGLTFNCSSGSNSGSIQTCNVANGFNRYEECAFNLVTTNASSRINVAAFDGTCEMSNCTASFGAIGQSFQMSGGNGIWLWRNKPGSTAITGATIPTTLYLAGSTFVGPITTWSGLDLSALGSGKTLSAAQAGRLDIINCKLGASVTVTTTPTVIAGLGVRVIGSHSTTNVSRNELYSYQGTLTTETTIKRTAGASDGTTAYSWKVVTTANAKRTYPFETFEGAVWNSATGSAKTLTIHTVTDNVTLTDAEIWVEVEYLGSSATPVSTLITDANATVLTTAANQATSTEAWTTTGLATPVYQKLEVTFTPQMAGPIRWRVKVAKASTTVYICPNADLS